MLSALNVQTPEICFKLQSITRVNILYGLLFDTDIVRVFLYYLHSEIARNNSLEAT